VASAGLPTDRFFFEGFLPPREQARRARLAELADVPATLVFFETGPRIAAMLHDLAAAFGDREAAVYRELTKLHEESAAPISQASPAPMTRAPRPAASSSAAGALAGAGTPGWKRDCLAGRTHHQIRRAM
jgi:hypothetical protein